MAHWCESCGQEVPEEGHRGDATWLDATTGPHEQAFTKPSGTNAGGRDKKFAAVFVGVLVVWGVFIGLSRIVSPDDAIDERAAAEIEAAQLEQLLGDAEQAGRQELADELAAAERAEEDALIADVLGDYAAADAAPGIPDASLIDPDAPTDDRRVEPAIDASNVGSRTAVQVQVERLQRQMIRRDSNAMVAYRSNQGVVLIDMQAGSAVVVADGPDTTLVSPGAPLLRAGPATYAVDPESLAVSQVGVGASVVLSQARDGNTYFVDSTTLAGQASTIEVVDGGSYGFHRVPAGGMQILPIDGLGLLAVPKGPTGATLIAGNNSFSQLSEHRVLDGNGQAILEQVCVSETACTLRISDLDSQPLSEVPTSFSRFGDQYVLSPNGELLLRYSPEGFGELFWSSGETAAASDSILWVSGAGIGDAAWDPSSNYLVWLDLLGNPELKVMFVDERDWLTIDLRDLGAPPPSSPDLIVFSPQN